MSKGILLTFPNTMGSPRESMLDCWVCVLILGVGFECEILRFVGVGFVGVRFLCEPLGSRAGSRGSFG
jgi:hypothetical protein